MHLRAISNIIKTIAVYRFISNAKIFFDCKVSANYHINSGFKINGFVKRFHTRTTHSLNVSALLPFSQAIWTSNFHFFSMPVIHSLLNIILLLHLHCD